MVITICGKDHYSVIVDGVEYIDDMTVNEFLASLTSKEIEDYYSFDLGEIFRRVWKEETEKYLKHKQDEMVNKSLN